MNHSCAPNGGVTYDSPGGTPPHPRHAPGESGSESEGGGDCYVSPPATARIVASKAIRAGEEITHSYVEAREPRSQRREALAHYGFDCDCVRCAKGDRRASSGSSSGGGGGAIRKRRLAWWWRPR